MNLREVFRTALAAARANLLPGLLLQCLMAVFLSAYISHEGTRRFLAEVATFKREAGYSFAFVSYVLSAALLPELLRIAFFQSGRPSRTNLWNFLTAAPAWGAMGVVVDAFYRCQNAWFGTGNGWEILLPKIFVDQFLFSPFFSNPLMIAYFLWRDAQFSRTARGHIFCTSFLREKLLPVQVAGWCIWIPGVALVYFMHPLLQLPVAVLIQCFWVLIFTTLGSEKTEPKPRFSADSSARKLPFIFRRRRK